METDQSLPTYVHQLFVFDFKSGVDASRYHCLSMVAVMCLEDGDVEKVSSSTLCADQLLKPIFSNTKNCTFLSHNGRSYENFFILRALEAQGHFPKKMQDASPEFMLTLSGTGCRFVDTLPFKSRSLAELPFD